MKLFKPKYKDKSGKTRECKNHYVMLTDRYGKRRRLPAFPSKRESERALVKIEELQSSRGIISTELQDWIDSIPVSMVDRLISFGLMKRSRISISNEKPLEEHLRDFRESLLAAGRKVAYVEQTVSRIVFIFSECGFKHYADIDGDKILVLLDGMQGEIGVGIGQRTVNAAIKACKHFCSWMVKRRRTRENLLDFLECIPQTEKRRERRAMTVKEQIKLLNAAEANGTHHNLTGYERVLVYTVALQTGFRANEIRNLTAGCFDFDKRTVALSGKYTKNKKDVIIALKPETSNLLKEYCSNKLPTAKVFAMPNQPAKMIKKDLEKAGIEYKTDEGQADFHALRCCFTSGLARQGVHPSVAQKLARHADINLTMSVYTKVEKDLMRDTIDQQPDLTKRIG